MLSIVFRKIVWSKEKNDSNCSDRVLVYFLVNCKIKDDFDPDTRNGLINFRRRSSSSSSTSSSSEDEKRKKRKRKKEKASSSSSDSDSDRDRKRKKRRRSPSYDSWLSNQAVINLLRFIFSNFVVYNFTALVCNVFFSFGIKWLRVSNYLFGISLRSLEAFLLQIKNRNIRNVDFVSRKIER